MKVNYVAAVNGCIELYSGLSNPIARSNDVRTLVDAVIAAGGFDEYLACSSSCDFAHEYGFESREEFFRLLDEVRGEVMDREYEKELI